MTGADDGAELQAARNFLHDPNAHFPQRPRIVDDLAVYDLPGGIGMQFRGGPRAVSIRGPEACRALNYLLRTLDGSCDLEELLAGCPADVAKASVAKTLSLMHSKGLLSGAGPPLGLRRKERGDSVLQRQLLFWSRNIGITGFRSSGEEVQDSLANTSVVLIGTGLFGASCCDLLERSGCPRISVVAWDDDGLLLSILQASQCRPERVTQLEKTSVEDAAAAVRDLLPRATIVVTATRNAPLSLFQSINGLCLDHDRPSLFGNDEGSEFEFGPYVIPGASACYVCKMMRFASAHPNMLEEHSYNLELAEERRSGLTKPKGESVVSTTLAASHLIGEAMRIVTGIAPPTLLDAVQILAPLTGTIETHRIRRVPRCPACSRGTDLPSDDDC